MKLLSSYEKGINVEGVPYMAEEFNLDGMVDMYLYENGQGVLAFDKPVIYVGLSYAKTLKTIVIPETVVEVGSFFNCENLAMMANFIYYKELKLHLVTKSKFI